MHTHVAMKLPEPPEQESIARMVQLALYIKAGKLSCQDPKLLQENVA